MIKALEVNPFAISSDGRFVALDGLAEFAPVPPREEWSPGADLGNLDAFFQPRGVAVVGVSADLSKYSLARDIAELLHELRRDDLYLVNPHGGHGAPRRPASTRCTRASPRCPFPVELAVYAAPAANAAGVPAVPSPAQQPCGAVVLIPGVPSAIPYRGVRAASCAPPCPPASASSDPTAWASTTRPPAARRASTRCSSMRKRLEVRSSRNGERGAPHAERRAAGDGHRQAAQLPAAALPW